MVWARKNPCAPEALSRPRLSLRSCGTGGTANANGSGDQGICGSGITVINSGTITGGLGALDGDAEANSENYATVGARATLPAIPLGDVALVPNFNLGWQHAFTHFLANQALVFATTGESFTATGAPWTATRPPFRPTWISS